MQTHRLDRSQPPIWAAVQWFASQAGKGTLDLSRTLVATPGARAGRVLVTLLAQHCQSQGLVLLPPQTVTAGQLHEALAPAKRPAGSLHRKLAWRRALAEAPASVLEPVLPPAAEPAAWADEVARLAEELARGGMRCRDVARTQLPPLEPPERWQMLGQLQQAYEAILHQSGLADPALHALDACDASQDPGIDELVLLACTDLTNLARQLIARGAFSTHVLVALDDGLVPDGVVEEEYWKSADIDVDPECIFVTGGPQEQGWLAVRAAVDLGTSVIGTADAALAGAVRRAARSHEMDVHVASGVPAAASGPVRLLGDIARLLREGSFDALVRVLKSPPVVLALRAKHPEYAKLPRALDDYLGAAIPTRAFEPLPEGDARVERPRHLIASARRRVIRALSPLRAPAMPLQQWASRLEEALIQLLEPAQDGLGDTSIAAVNAIGQQLRSLAGLPDALDHENVSASLAIDLLIAELSSETLTTEPGGEDLDVLGWLELPLDPAPAMVVLGAHDATLPGAGSASPLLSEGLRRALGLPGQDRTLARDAASLVTLLSNGRVVRFVLGTSNAAGDPLLPSTLLLRGPGDAPARVLARVRDAFETLPASEPPPKCTYRVGVTADAKPIERMAVTSFKTFLESPYLFYLRHAHKLTEVQPPCIIPRLEGNTFGTLIHEALRRFAGDEANQTVSDESTIRQLMHAALRETLEIWAGPSRNATVMAQIDAAERRLAHLAKLEAQRRDAGWKTIAVEWRPAQTTPLLDTGICLTGSIDRVDLNDDGSLALLDYKTAETGRSPNATHRRRDGQWIDLQLPLYEVLATSLAIEHAIERPPTLGYVALSSAEACLLEANWDESDRQSAVDRAAEIARCVRKGQEAMHRLGRPAYKSALTRLAGVGLLLDPEHDLFPAEDNA